MCKLLFFVVVYICFLIMCLFFMQIGPRALAELQEIGRTFACRDFGRNN